MGQGCHSTDARLNITLQGFIHQVNSLPDDYFVLELLVVSARVHAIPNQLDGTDTIDKPSYERNNPNAESHSFV